MSARTWPFNAAARLPPRSSAATLVDAPTTVAASKRSNKRLRGLTRTLPVTDFLTIGGMEAVTCRPASIYPRMSALPSGRATIFRATPACLTVTNFCLVKCVDMDNLSVPLFGASEMSGIDGWIRMRLRSILRKRRGLQGRGRGSDHRRWPNRYFTKPGLFCLLDARESTFASLSNGANH